MGQTIMIQGTASGVGKSTLVTGLCRILRQEGYSAAPFKAQNMSANAYVFPDGRQIAKSQAIAAFACGAKPVVDMNPVLLKPHTYSGAEVIINGVSVGFLNDFEYNALKRRLPEEIFAAYQRLLHQYDFVVVEGAGSPVELNLKENDAVNMGFAKKAQCPVILAADISRGGVFASVYGTVMLMEKEEREQIKGIIINKFCGKKEYFQSGVSILEELTQIPVIGIMPYTKIDIEDEDSPVDGENLKTETGIKKKLGGRMRYQDYLDIQFDKLAQVMRENLDIGQILHIAEG